MGINGMVVVAENIHSAFHRRQLATEALAAEYSRKAIRLFRQRQMSAEHQPAGKRKQKRKGAKDDEGDLSKAEAFAKEHSGGAPATSMGKVWTNRTFRAARTVFAQYGSNSKQVYFSLHHRMPYGVYLELGWNRKFAVIEPIIRSLAPNFMKDLKALYAD